MTVLQNLIDSQSISDVYQLPRKAQMPEEDDWPEWKQPDDSPRTAGDILRHAAALIDDRGQQRDKPAGERSMAATVTAFNALFGHALTETQGWQFMQLLKIARSAAGSYQPDDHDDGVAYAALAAESAEREHV